MHKVARLVLAATLPLLVTPVVLAKSPSAQQQFNAVMQSTDTAPYSQETVTQAENISYKGNQMTVRSVIHIRRQIVNGSAEVYETVDMQLGAEQMQEQVYVAKNTLYVNNGQGWTFEGHITAKQLQSLEGQTDAAFDHVREQRTKSGWTFTADEDPSGLASMAKRVLSMVQPSTASSISSKTLVKLVEQVLKSTKGQVVVYARDYGKVERMQKLTLHMTMKIPGAMMQQLASEAGSADAGTAGTVTGAVYGGKGGNKGGSALSMVLNETATVDYAKVTVSAPKGLPK